MLEFWLDPESTYYQSNKIKEIKKMALFCALGWRSALATKSLVDMGFTNVAHVDGGFDALKKSGLKIVEKKKS
jgi:rhodanese-related sulfurtransferase